MSEQLQTKILSHLKSGEYRPQAERALAKDLNLHEAEEFHAFRDALKELMHAGRVVLGASGTILLPAEKSKGDEFIGSYRHNKRGFGFVVPSDPTGHEDLYIPEGQNNGAMSNDVVRAKIMSKGNRDGKVIYSGRVTEIITRGTKHFVGTLAKQHGQWMVLPDGNTLTDPIMAPDAGSRHIRPGTKVVIELTTFPGDGEKAQGVITEVLGQAGEKDVDLKSVLVQFNLPSDFPEEVKAQARKALDAFDPEAERGVRLDLTDQIICTIDPDDAKDYDDAISLRKLETGQWQLGVHIADVSHFVPKGTPLDIEARERGNSCYFPGYVIPMLPEILSNGVCSLQGGVPRLCKSAFITYDEDARPVATKFANTVIRSKARFRYREAQAILDNAEVIPHPDGDKKISDYDPEVLSLLRDMNTLSRALQKRRQEQGQIVLDLPETELVLDEDGKVVDAVPEDQSFTHTLIEMFMVEANEAVARLLNSQNLPFLRRTHPEPEIGNSDRLRQFAQVAGYKLPKEVDRKAIQSLLASVKGKPESFAISLAVLKSLTRAEYSPQIIGHYALASEHYGHFTSPIRRYADLTIHRLLDAYFEARDAASGGKRKKKIKVDPDDVPSYDDLMELGKHLSFTERRADDAERELRQVKLLELMKNHIGDEFLAVVTGITNFGVFLQIQNYLIDGLIRYENLMDDWWDVDAAAGTVRGQRTGKKITIGDVCKVIVARVDPARRELDLSISQLLGKAGQPLPPTDGPNKPKTGGRPHPNQKNQKRGGAPMKGRGGPPRGGASRGRAGQKRRRR